jgi:hypothetical protein
MYQLAPSDDDEHVKTIPPRSSSWLVRIVLAVSLAVNVVLAAVLVIAESPGDPQLKVWCKSLPSCS